MGFLRRIAGVVLGVVSGVIVVGVLGANRQWAEIVLPAAPWSDAPRILTMEVQVWALLVVPFLAGATFALLVGASRRRRKRRPGVEEMAWPPTGPDLRG